MHFIQPYRHSLLSPNGASAYHKVSAYVSKQRLCGNTYLNTQSYFVLDPMGSHCEGPNSIAEQCTWKLWCKTVTALLQALPSFHKQIIIPIMFCIISPTVWVIENVPNRHQNITDTDVTQRSTYTVRLQKNGAVPKVNKKFISHLTRAQRTPKAAATIQVSHALPAVRFSCLLRGQFTTWRRSRKRLSVCSCCDAML